MVATTKSIPPVLFLIFNRPDTTTQVFEQIRKVQPTRLFIAADGPRADRDGEVELCEQARRIAEDVDWDCEIKTLYRDHNLGCRKAVSSAISWFFEQVEEGIILEDDCLPELSFFRFCAELLERYREDTRVMCISGESYGDPSIYKSSAYGFSKYALIWGWATWRRAWKMYDDDMTGFADKVNRGWFDAYFGSAEVSHYWQFHFKQADDQQVNSWGFRWLYTVICQGGSCIVSSINQVQNIGCDTRATHTYDPQWMMAERPTQPMRFPMSHPKHPAPNPLLARELEQERYLIKMKPRYASRLFARLDPICEKIVQNFHKFRNFLRQVLCRKPGD